MKSAASAMIFVFKSLAKKIKYPLALQIVTDLQSGGNNGTKYQLEQGVRGEFVITGASTKFSIANESKGVLWLKITSKGKKAPGADPWLGDNALWKLKKALDNIEKAYPVPAGDTWKTTINLGKIETTNQLVNLVPNEASALLDIRYIPMEKEHILQDIKKLLPLDCETEILQHASPEFTAMDNPYVLKLNDAVQSVIKKKAEIVKKNFSNDIWHYNELGMSGVSFGPMTGGNYADEEWVDIESISDYYRSIKGFLLNLSLD